MPSWVQNWLSEPRLQRYISECHGDEELAFRLYAWNGKVASAFLRDLSDLEVLVRNAFDRAVQEQWDGPAHWLIDPSSPILVVKWKDDGSDRNHIARDSIASAIDKAGGLGVATPGKIVAELTFGFWASLVTKVREHDVWTPYVSRAFISPRPERKEVNRRMVAINGLRNRVAHHEPLINYDLDKMHNRILDLCGWISPEVQEHVRSETSVPALIAERPN
jgi:hypothetical protein